MSVDLGPLEADFAELNTDLARLAQGRHTLAGDVVALLDQMIDETNAAGPPAEGDLGGRFQDAMYKILKEGAAADLHGNLGFDIDQKSLVVHAAPVVQEVVAVVQEKVQSFVDEITTSVMAGVPQPPPPEGAPEAPPGEKRPPKLKVDIAGLFAGLLQNAIQQAKTPPKKG